MDDFFPSSDYKMPESSNYMKFKEGENTFRVLSSAIVGYEYWNTSGKPVRTRQAMDELPDDIKVEKDGSKRISHFWAFVVWNYDAQKIQILQLTQKGIMKSIQAYVQNSRWGNPKNYDITVTRTGSGLDTEYSVMANPHSVLLPEIQQQSQKKNINLEALYEGKDPFTE